jgi:spoIIIJ-associated protein
MREIERSAPSVEEALEAALAELGVSEQEATIEIVQEPRSGFLGISSQPAVIRVRVAGDGSAGSAGSAAQEEDVDLDEQADVAAEFLEGLLDRMGLMAEVEITDADGVTYVDVWGEDDEESIGLLIGRRGATLDGMQELVRTVVQQQTGERCRVLVDVEDYRKRRRTQLLERAREVGRRIQKSGREEALEPMSAYERKLVHDAIAEIAGLETQSEGEEPNRRVVIRRAP